MMSPYMLIRDAFHLKQAGDLFPFRSIKLSIQLFSRIWSTLPEGMMYQMLYFCFTRRPTKQIWIEQRLMIKLLII